MLDRALFLLGALLAALGAAGAATAGEDPTRDGLPLEARPNAPVVVSIPWQARTRPAPAAPLPESTARPEADIAPSARPVPSLPDVAAAPSPSLAAELRAAEALYYAGRYEELLERADDLGAVQRLASASARSEGAAERAALELVIGSARWATGKRDSARTHFARALEIDPNLDTSQLSPPIVEALESVRKQGQP